MRARPAPKPDSRLRRGSGRVTMDEVARLAGVSTSTVSRVLREPGAVSDDLAGKVRSAVDRLGYVPNLMAGGLAAARGRTVGVIVPSILNSFFAGTIDTLSGLLSSAGWQVLDGSTDYSESREEALVEAFLAWSPAAMVLTGLRHSQRTVRLLRAARIPVVEMWDVSDGPIDIAVGFSHREAGRTMTQYLIEKGRRRIVFVGAIMSSDQRAAQRAEGHREAMTAAGLPVTAIDLPGRSSVALGGPALADLLARQVEMDALYFSNDVLALGALFECHRRGIAVPSRLSIAGFGDLDFAASCVPPLTTIRPPREAIGRETAAILLARFAGQTHLRRAVDLGFELQVRRSA